ncbi:MAG: hypothetical protein ACREX1_13060, partial [Advenella sp.]
MYSSRSGHTGSNGSFMGGAPADNHNAPGPYQISPRLYNADLAPTRTQGRRWGRYSFFALWTNDVHNIANYSFAIG